MSARIEFFRSNKAIVKIGSNIEVVGDKRFRENLSVIDMSLCPSLLDNMMYVSEKSIKPISYSSKNIQEAIIKHKLRGITADLPRYIAPFIKDGII